MIGLTPMQARCLDAIKNYTTAHGCSPSFSELQERVGLSSKNGVHRLLDALEERGAIRRLRHRARSIEVIGTPGGQDFMTMPIEALRQHIAVASGILAHRTGGGRLTPVSTALAPVSPGGR